MFRIAVCDDEKKILVCLRDCLERFSQEQRLELEILEYTSADALLQNYPAGIDLLLLDIYMTGVDGMAAARQIRTFDPQVCIIFITTMYQRAIEGYGVRAFGFIKKPVNYAELSHELHCALKQIDRNREELHYISVRSSGTIYRLPTEQITYCEVRDHSVFAAVDGKLFEYRCSLKEFEEQLWPYGFFRCHASFLVNCHAIRQIDAASLTLMDGTELPISQRRRRDFLAALAEYIGETL